MQQLQPSLLPLLLPLPLLPLLLLLLPLPLLLLLLLQYNYYICVCFHTVVSSSNRDDIRVAIAISAVLPTVSNVVGK